MKIIKLKMSLSQNINSYIDDTVSKYIRIISTKYNLDYNSLISEWKGGCEQPIVKVETTKTQPKPTPKVVESKAETKVESKSEDTNDSLMLLTKQELQERCRKAGVRSSGTKNELVKYLLEKKPLKTTQTKMPEFIKTSTPLPQEEKKTEQKPTIIKKITASQPVFNIRRNKFNNYEDINTGFVFNNLSKKVIGKQNSDGTISDLTKEDINICNKYKFKYVLPNNLDKNTRTEDVKVEELDEEEEEADDGGEEVVEEEVEVEVEAEPVDDEDAEEVDDDDAEEEELLEEEDIIEDDE
jgi:hypothetical protein